NLLNKKRFTAFGIEPYPKEFDNIKSFKGTLNKFPKKLEQKYNIILANIVYSINYSHSFPKKFKWELKNKRKLIKKLRFLIKPKGYLILIDDLGTIFLKKELKKYFKILLFEKDCHSKITLLQKRM
ncbi:MAG: class I SAM-dependent methyltransferase, partial [Nanoarchaeota archaeon]|nr:class I SAM-dependent methyltransferase [Nanoarchaeota archaeon]